MISFIRKTMIFVLLGIAIVYVLAISWLIYGFTKINQFEFIGLPPKTSFSIIVPFRNESENLPVLLESFSKLNYPTYLFEVILVDDASDLRFKINDFKFKILYIFHIFHSFHISYYFLLKPFYVYQRLCLLYCQI